MAYEMKEVLYNHNHNMNKKKWLSRYRNNQIKISKLSQRLEILEQKMTSTKSPNLSGMPRGGVPVTMADMVADKVDLEERIAQLKEDNREVKREITRAIDSLEKLLYVEILEYHYIDGLTIEEIADRMRYTLRYIHMLYREALDALDIPELNTQAEGQEE